MNWFGWFLVISLSVFVISMITIGIILIVKLRSRNNVQGTIILKAGGQKKFLINRKKSTIVNVNNETYLFDEKAILKTKFKDFIYYMEGNPNPIIYNFETNKPEIIAQDLKTILDSDLITKLFTLKELKTIQILLIIALIMGFITIVLLVYLVMSGVTLKDNESNRLFLENVTRTVLQSY